MRTREQLLAAALKTHESEALFMLLQDALDLVAFTAGQAAIANGKLETANKQIERQTGMIENLEKTLWGKK